MGKPEAAGERTDAHTDPGLDRMLEGLRSGDRGMLARAITLVESDRPADRQAAARLVEACLPPTVSSLRIGVTGVPGVGKSTFIESLGLKLVQSGRRLAVLAVDPSSDISGGSILGDKTRMAGLAADERAFIRPSPARGVLGGVTGRTRETIVLFEAAGHDTVFVETVGVGQAETAAYGVVDCFLLLLLPGAGDELQGMKRGIVERADLLAVNKADGERGAAARETAADYRRALHLLPPSESGWNPPVIACSGLTGEGLDEVWERIGAFAARMREGGHFQARRREQALAWFRAAFREGLQEAVRSRPGMDDALREAEAVVRSGERHPPSVARDLLARWAAAADGHG